MEKPKKDNTKENPWTWKVLLKVKLNSSNNNDDDDDDDDDNTLVVNSRQQYKALLDLYANTKWLNISNWFQITDLFEQ